MVITQKCVLTARSAITLTGITIGRNYSTPHKRPPKIIPEHEVNALLIGARTFKGECTL